MKTNPLISVIIPIHNVASDLPRCLDSICNQTYRNLEIILVDDGSTDSSAEICQAYAAKDSRITVIHQKNEGVSSARNAGLKISKGDLISFVDADDYIHPQGYQLLAELHEQTKSDLIWAQAEYVYPGQTSQVIRPTTNFQELTLEDFLTCSARQKDFFIWNKLFARTIITTSFPLGQKLAEDWSFVFSCVQNARKIVRTSFVFYYYYQRPDSAVHTLSVTARTQAFDTWADTYKKCKELQLPQATQAVLSVAMGAAAVLAITVLLQPDISTHQKSLERARSFLNQHVQFLSQNHDMGFLGKLFSWFLVKAPKATVFCCQIPGIRCLLTKICQKRFTAIQHPEPALPKTYKVVLHYEVFARNGGVERILINWYQCAPQFGWQFDFAVENRNLLDVDFVQTVLKNGNQFLASTASTNNAWKERFCFYKQLYQMLRKGNYDFFFCHHWPFPIFILHCIIAKMAGVRKIGIMSHSGLVPERCGWRRRIFKICCHLFTTHKFAVSKEAANALFGSCQDVTILHPAIETKAFSFDPVLRQAVREELHLSKRLVLGHVGRLAEVKNHKFILEIFKQINLLNPNAVLVFVGDGLLKDELRQYAQYLQIAPHVQFLGEKDDPQRYYQAFDGFLFPSLAEGLPLALLEAQTSGLPCFVSDTVSKEAFICNVTTLSLNEPAQVWANTILNTLKNFQRTDQSDKIAAAGFTAYHTLQLLKNTCENGPTDPKTSF